MEIWNQRYVPKPSYITIVYKRNHLQDICNKLKHTNSDYQDVSVITSNSPESLVSNLTSLLTEFESVLESTRKSFKYEVGCLQAFIYHNAQLRKEKLMQVLPKVKKCLRRLDEIDVYSLIKIIREMIPTQFIYIESIRLPSTSCLYYILHRLVGSFYLLQRCLSYCLESALYLRSKLSRGHFMAQMTLGYAIVGRLRAFCIDLLNTISSNYDKLSLYILPMMEIFPPLTNPEPLPKNLRKELLCQFGKSNLGSDQEIESIMVPKKKAKKNSAPNDATSTSRDFSLVDMFLYGDGSKEESVSAVLEGGEMNGKAIEDGIAFGLSSENVDDGDEDLGEHVSYYNFNKLNMLSGDIIATKKIKNNGSGEPLYSFSEFKPIMEKKKKYSSKSHENRKFQNNNENLVSLKSTKYKKSKIQSSTDNSYPPNKKKKK